MAITRNVGTLVVAMNAATIRNVQKFSADIDLESAGQIGMQVSIAAAFPSGPTSDLDWKMYARLASTYTGKEVAMTSGRIAKVASASQVQAILLEPAPLHCRFGCSRTAAADTITVTIGYQPYNYLSS